jgi:predicted nucleic acid-binding protein
VLIEAERTGRTIAEVFSRLHHRGSLAISSVTLMELAEGIARAKDETTRIRRRRFLDAVRSSLDVLPLDAERAVAAGLLNGELRKTGATIGLADAMIASTALQNGDGVATLNAKHFRLVPDLVVVEM